MHQGFSSISLSYEQKKTRRFPSRRRKCALNESAFEAVTEESAYWLGFLTVDGCVTRDKRFPSSQPKLKVNLGLKDLAQLQKLRDFLGFEGEITICEKYCSMTVSSRRITEDLARYGVVPRKSQRTIAHSLLEHNRHFWRGVVDGDGGIYVKVGNNYPSIYLAGSERLLRQFARYLLFAGLTKRLTTVRPCRSTMQLAVAGRHAVNIIEHLYHDSRVALDRKQTLATAVIELWRE